MTSVRLRQLDWASRDMRRRHKQVEAATGDLAGTLQRNPTEAEVAEKLGMDPQRWRGMMLDLRNVGLISASTRSNEYEDQRFAGRSISTTSEFSRNRSNTICLPSGVMSKVRVARLLKFASWRVFLAAKSSNQKFSGATWDAVGTYTSSRRPGTKR